MDLRLIMMMMLLLCQKDPEPSQYCIAIANAENEQKKEVLCIERKEEKQPCLKA